VSIPDSKSRSDRELWVELRKGNKKALRALFLRHHDSLYQYGLAICSKKLVIEDCLQDLFFQLWKTHRQLSEVNKVKSYLWVSFRRRLMKQLQKRNNHDSQFTSFMPRMKIETSTEQDIIQREQKLSNHEVLEKVVETLTHREREVLYLKYYDGMSYREIQKLLDINYQTARNYVYRAISRLRDLLDREGLKIVLSVIILLIT